MNEDNRLSATFAPAMIIAILSIVVLVMLMYNTVPYESDEPAFQAYVQQHPKPDFICAQIILGTQTFMALACAALCLIRDDDEKKNKELCLIGWVIAAIAYAAIGAFISLNSKNITVSDCDDVIRPILLLLSAIPIIATYICMMHPAKEHESEDEAEARLRKKRIVKEYQRSMNPKKG